LSIKGMCARQSDCAPAMDIRLADDELSFIFMRG
jgi:hypothetical protein